MSLRPVDAEPRDSVRGLVLHELLHRKVGRAFQPDSFDRQRDLASRIRHIRLASLTYAGRLIEPGDVPGEEIVRLMRSETLWIAAQTHCGLAGIIDHADGCPGQGPNRRHAGDALGAQSRRIQVCRPGAARAACENNVPTLLRTIVAKHLFQVSTHGTRTRNPHAKASPRSKNRWPRSRFICSVSSRMELSIRRAVGTSAHVPRDERKTQQVRRRHPPLAPADGHVDSQPSRPDAVSDVPFRHCQQQFA